MQLKKIITKASEKSKGFSTETKTKVGRPSGKEKSFMPARRPAGRVYFSMQLGGSSILLALLQRRLFPFLLPGQGWHLKVT